MARKLRLQFEGAIYHVINRGNYRLNLFENPGSLQAFRACLFEGAEQAGWLLHAFALMINHFHLAVQTPRANLVEGMHWLQSTFATRFNRFRHENGHLFQGRYRAILVEPGPSLLRVVNYIHLNPVRAGVIGPEQLAVYPWTSASLFIRGPRPAPLVCAEWLGELELPDNPAGWSAYQAYLQSLAANRREQSNLGFGAMNRGWAIGTNGWRAAVAKDHARLSLNQGYRKSETIEVKVLQWQAALDRILVEIGKTESDIQADRKGAGWKVAAVQALRSQTTASLSWIAARLRMGTADSVSHHLYLARLKKRQITEFRA